MLERCLTGEWECSEMGLMVFGETESCPERTEELSGCDAMAAGRTRLQQDATVSYGSPRSGQRSAGSTWCGLKLAKLGSASSRTDSKQGELEIARRRGFRVS